MKHTKKYAEKLAATHTVCISETWSNASFTVGYMKAIEETNVKELLEALKLAKSRLNSLGFDHNSNTILKIDNAIKKATE